MPTSESAVWRDVASLPRRPLGLIARTVDGAEVPLMWDAAAGRWAVLEETRHPMTGMHILRPTATHLDVGEITGWRAL